VIIGLSYGLNYGPKVWEGVNQQKTGRTKLNRILNGG
jgi:hypothetical protein